MLKILLPVSCLVLSLVGMGSLSIKIHAQHNPEQALAKTVSQLWKALSTDEGKTADVATLKELLHPQAIIFASYYKKDGTPVLRKQSLEDFLAPLLKPSSRGFYECEVSRSIQTQDRFASVTSVVESRWNAASEQADMIGINSLQMTKEGDQWRIISLYYHLGKKENPVLVDKKLSGQCLG